MYFYGTTDLREVFLFSLGLRGARYMRLVVRLLNTVQMMLPRATSHDGKNTEDRQGTKLAQIETSTHPYAVTA